MVDVANPRINPKFSENDVMTPPEVAEVFHCHPLTLLRWHNMGVGPPRIKIGRKFFTTAAMLMRTCRA